jgi:DNA repair protein RecN (Recombination protein N)
MLGEVTLKDLGVIDGARLGFAAGFTVITGETGAGKTMLLTALDLLRGGKADPALVREGAARALVEGVIVLPAGHPALAAAVDAGALVDDGELLVGRTISPSRSRALLGGTSVPAGVLASVVAPLVAVHGQADQMRLRLPAQQREVLDAYAGQDHAEALAAYRETYAAVEDLRSTLERLQGLGAAAVREADMLAQGLAEIERAGASIGEDEEIDARIERLTHAEDLRVAVTHAHAALAGLDEPASPPGASALVVQACRALEGVASRDGALASLAERLREMEYQVADAGEELAAYLGELDADPASLETLHARRAELRALTRKYGPTLEDVAAWQRQAAARLEDLDAGDHHIAELTGKLSETLATLGTQANRVSAGRRQAAQRLAEAIDAELTGLAMSGAHIRIDVTTAQPGPHGADEVSMLLSPHPGAPARPLGRTASGGELSRVMLAVEVALAAARGRPDETLVFDEVDAGIGGRAAIEVGRRLARVAAHTQVIVVTHLAQVAAFADHHIVVDKHADDAAPRAVTTVAEVSGPARERELARMLAGHEDSASAQAHAQELLALRGGVQGE